MSGVLKQKIAPDTTSRSDLIEWLEVQLPKLTFREREIIKLRYGCGGYHIYTLQEVGRIFKVTRERVRMLQNRAEQRLRELWEIDAEGKCK